MNEDVLVLFGKRQSLLLCFSVYYAYFILYYFCIFAVDDGSSRTSPAATPFRSAFFAGAASKNFQHF